MTDTGRVIRGWTGRSFGNRMLIATDGPSLVDAFNHNKPIEQWPVLVIPLTSDGHIPEALVERAKAACGDMGYLAGVKNTIVRDVLTSLLPN